MILRKQCSDCKKRKTFCNDVPLPNGEHHPDCQFFLRKDTKDGHGYYCKSCAKAAEKISRDKRARKEAKRLYMREWRRRRQDGQVAS